MTFLNTLTNSKTSYFYSSFEYSRKARKKTNVRSNEHRREVWSLSIKREKISNRVVKIQKRGYIKIGTFVAQRVCGGN